MSRNFLRTKLSSLLLSSSFLLPVALCSFSLCPVVVAKDNWPSWRGPAGNGTAPTGDYPTKWDIKADGKEGSVGLKWHYAIPGRGASTPVVWEDRIYITTGAEEKNWLIALSLDGKEVWRKELGSERAGKHRNGTGSNPSPVTDGNSVFAYFKSGDLACLSPDGKVVWQTNIQSKYSEDTLWWDLGTSPVLTENAIVITVMHSGPSFLVAFDKKSGEVLWKSDRNLDAPEEAAQSYTTPTLLSSKDGDQLLVLGADHVTSHSSKDGKQLWKLGGLNPEGNKFFRSISSPVIAGDLIICPYSRGNSLTAVHLDGSLSEDKRIAWQAELGSDVPTPAVSGDRVMVLGDNGRIWRLDVTSGKVIWQDRLPKSQAKFYSSPVIANGHLYATREDGMTFVVKDADTFEVVASNEVPGEMVATPVFVNGHVLLRTFDGLYCVAK